MKYCYKCNFEELEFEFKKNKKFKKEFKNYI